MATGDFDLYYPDSPWDGITTNQRQWYDPTLRNLYQRRAVYSRFVTNQFSTLGRPSTSPMVVTSLIEPHVNTDALGSRVMWTNASYMDSQSRTLNVSRYAGKLAYQEYDDLITYWKKDGKRGLRNIINSGIGNMMVEEMEMHARNAFLLGAMTAGGYALYGNGGSDFSDITDTGHGISTSLIEDIHLGMDDRNLPLSDVDSPDLRGGIICITSPGVIRDLRNEISANGWGAEWLDVARYANPAGIMRGEMGTYKGVRFVKTTRATLYNMGEILVESPATAAITAGDGAPGASANVDGVWDVGQPSGVTNYIQLGGNTDATEMGLWENYINQKVTIHTSRTSDYGVTNGVKLDDGTLYERRLISVDVANLRLVFDKPILSDFSVSLGSENGDTVYAWVTKGRNIHSAAFLGSHDGIVTGIHRAPQIHTPRPVDDFDSMYRVSYDMYMGWNLWEPQAFEVAFLAGSNRIKGSRVSYPAP